MIVNHQLWFWVPCILGRREKCYYSRRGAYFSWTSGGKSGESVLANLSYSYADVPLKYDTFDFPSESTCPTVSKTGAAWGYNTAVANFSKGVLGSQGRKQSIGRSASILLCTAEIYSSVPHMFIETFASCPQSGYCFHPSFFKARTQKRHEVKAMEETLELATK